MVKYTKHSSVCHPDERIKISTGEPGGHNFLQPSLIKDLVQKVSGTIVECNTAHVGKRFYTEEHIQAAKDHGFFDIEMTSYGF